MQATQTVVYDSNGNETIHDQLALANGVVVRELDDLRQVVDPGSPTAQSLNAAAHHDSRFFWTRAGASTSLVAGLGFSIAAFADGGHELYAIPAAVALGGTVYFIYSAFKHTKLRKKSRMKAMTSFEASLRSRLDLRDEDLTGDCGRGGQW